MRELDFTPQERRQTIFRFVFMLSALHAFRLDTKAAEIAGMMVGRSDKTVRE